jgi:cytochrome c2
VVASLGILFSGCSSRGDGIAPVPGNSENGRLLLEQYACGTCHVIPGVRQALGQLGPPLGSFSRHVYIAGEVPNDPATLSRWIQDPRELVPGTTMPDLGVHERHARDMVAYLYELP